MTNPTDWTQFYQQNMSNQETILFGDYSTVTSTTTTTTSTVSSGLLGLGSAHLSPEGRIGKPIRRRSRASRRTPTTLFNTDTTNFRTMVQQFTGGPRAPFATPSLSFGHQVHTNAPSSMMVVPGSGYQYHIRYPPQQQQQNRPYMVQLSGNSRNILFGNTRTPNTVGGGGSEGFGVAEGVSSQVPPSRTSSSNENRSDSFMF